MQHRRRDPAGTARGLLRPLTAGALALTLPILVQAALTPVLGDGFAVFLLFFLALIPGFGAALVYCGDSLFRLFLAALLMLLVPFASLALPEARLFGLVPVTTPEAATGRPAAAGFRLPGAAPDPAFQQVVSISRTHRGTDLRGRPAAPFTSRGTFAVVPVVSAGWEPLQRVHVVAVQDLQSAGQAPQPWAPAGGVLRLLPDPLRERAVGEALRAAGLSAASGLVIGRWVESPGWARLAEALPLLQLLGGAMLAWTLLLALGRRGSH